jgi:mRNA degradation ribonuclease J1/J2
MSALHASGREVRETMEKINPKMIILIHTDKPEHLKQHFDNVTHQKLGVTITL